MLRRIPALVVLLLVAATALVAAAEPSEIVYSVHYVESGDARIRVEIQRDTAFDGEGQPVILTYSPYNNLASAGDGQTANDGVAAEYNPRGYARAVADVIGTRGSTGCWDYGGEAEIQSGVDVVRFLGGTTADEAGEKLTWSNGKVAMIGGSYNGTTATMVASRGDEVPELAAIVPQAAISRWYGYAYEGGVRYFLNSFAPTDEGFDTPLAFDLGFGRTVEPMDATGRPADLGDQTAARTGECGTAEHTEEAYSRQPDYDEFWLARDYLHDAEFRAAALIAHGWQDYNVKQRHAIDLWDAMPVDDPATHKVDGVPFKLLWMTQGTHGGATDGELYPQLELEFFEHTLRGVPLGELPLLRERVRRWPVRTVSATSDGESQGLLQHSWPPRDTSELTLHLGRTFDYPVDGAPREGLVGSTGETGILSLEPQDDGAFAWIDTGLASEPFAENDPLNEPGHGYYSLLYASPPLEGDLRIAGSAQLDGWFRSATGPGVHLTPILLDLAPDGSATVAARGFLNLDYRDGLEEADPLGSFEWAHAAVDLLPQDHTFRAGHRIAVLTMSSNTVWAVPGNPGGAVNIANGPIEGVTERGTVLRLPVVGLRGPEHRLFVRE